MELQDSFPFPGPAMCGGAGEGQGCCGMAAGAGRAAAGGARCSAQGLRTEGVQRNLEPRGPAVQRPGAVVRGRDPVLPRPCQAHGGLEVWGWCSGPGVTEAPHPPAPTMAGPPPSRASVRLHRHQGLRGCRAPLVLLGPGLLGERVTRARVGRAEPVTPRPVSPVSPGRARPASPHGEGRSRCGFIGAASALASVC